MEQAAESRGAEPGEPLAEIRVREVRLRAMPLHGQTMEREKALEIVVLGQGNSHPARPFDQTTEALLHSLPLRREILQRNQVTVAGPCLPAAADEGSHIRQRMTRLQHDLRGLQLPGGIRQGAECLDFPGSVLGGVLRGESPQNRAVIVQQESATNPESVTGRLEIQGKPSDQFLAAASRQNAELPPSRRRENVEILRQSIRSPVWRSRDQAGPGTVLRGREGFYGQGRAHEASFLRIMPAISPQAGSGSDQRNTGCR